MAVYVVTEFEPRSQLRRKEDCVPQAPERYQNVADPDLESVRWVSGDMSAHDLSADLQQKLDKNDGIFVSQLVRGEYQGYLSKATWEWISQRLD